MNVRTLIGESVHRAEDFRFLKGAGRFVDDLKREGMLHAVVLRSPVAHGRIRRIDASAARAMPGVHAVMTAADIGAACRSFRCGSPTCRSSRAISSRSSPTTRCAMSASRSRWWWRRPRAQAEDALEAIEVDIERLAGAAGPSCGRRRQIAVVRRRQQPRGALRGVVRRCRCGVCQGGIHAQGNVPLPPADRIAAGDARADFRMGCGQEAAHGVRRDQGAVLQPPHARADARRHREPTST